MADTKAHLVALLENREFHEIPVLARRDSATVRKLFALLYDRDPLLRWRSVMGFGWLAEQWPEGVERTLSRLAYALNDEASICGWMSAPAIGEMTGRNPSLTGRVVRIVVHYITDVETCHGGNRNVEILCSALWAIGRIATRHPELLGEVQDTVTRFMADPESMVRAHALWCVGHAGRGGVFQIPPSALTDDAPARVFDPASASFQEEPVAFFARMALSLPSPTGVVG